MLLGGQDAVVSTPLFPMKGLYWNCRGLKDPFAPAVPKIRAICRSFHNNLDFVFLSETKCDVLSVDVLLRPIYGFPSCKGSMWYLCCVYGEPDHSKRGPVWENFTHHLSSLDKPFLLIGDFNQVEFASDKLGGSDKLIRGANLFSYWKNSHCLMDIPFKGPAIIGMVHIEYTKELIRDLLPKKVYRLESWCFDHAECSGLVKESWERKAMGDASHVLLAKLRRINNAFRDLESYLLDIENGGDSVNYESCHKKLMEFSLAAGTYWRQRTKLKWNCEGDTCTKYFFSWVKGRSGANLILGIKKESNEWTFDMKEIGGLFHKHFSTIFNSDSEPECFEDYLNKFGYLFNNLKHKVGMEERAKLGRDFSKNEVRAAVFQLGPLKSSGPDGIPTAFYQKYWAIVKNDVIKGALNILNSGTVLKDFNKTFIVLIPKNDCPERVGDFRPISLCNVIMKVVTKCIANRLKGVMDDLVSPFQSAFVPNRSIADNIVIAQEILHAINRGRYGKMGMMAFKDDMSKAYDRLNWNFIRGVLSYLNLPGSMVQLIMSTIESVSYEILINGAPMGTVNPGCGIRQGDPLSPYIFALCTEVLSQMILYAQDCHLIKGIKICKTGPEISHLLFADDSLFFIRGDFGNLDFLMNIIDEYCAASGQCLNKDKSSILFSPNCSLMTVKKCLTEFKFSPKHDLGNYLGLPTSIGSSKREFFKFLIDKTKRRLSSWNNILLSSAGKLTLIRSVLSSLSLFSLSVFRIPVSVTSKLQSLMVHFWRSGTRNNKSIHWCSKDFLSRPVGEGGLGLRNIGCFNQALLAKSAWRILCVPGSLISKVIGPKLGVQDDILFQNQGYSLLDLCGDIIDAPIDSSLLVGDLHDSHRRWDLSSPGFDPGEDVTKKIFATYIPCQPSNDSFYWKFSKHGAFTVKSGNYVAAMALTNGSTSTADLSRMSATIVTFCRSKLWKLPISNKLKVFLWKFMANALPVGSEFLKRKMNWRSYCTLCDGSSPCVESLSHLFRDCSFAKALWNEMVFKNRRPWPMNALHSILGDIQCMKEVVCIKDASLLRAPLLDFSPGFGLAKRIRNSFPYWIVGGPGCGHVCTVKCDAAWRADRSAGMGWCFLDDNGTLRNSAHARSFASSALHAEGLAVFMALKWASDEGFLHVRLVTDCFNLVLQAAGAEKPIASINCIIQDIIKFIASNFHCCSLSFCPRGVNRIAHNLAQRALV
ncbi:uncharacterized protein LOC141616907 [Silene latifolia]|uniref:uncharacterized protein LOC141616907 n=1 Tax=Silene latifolia TaxID=37657 RepID=UPI003D76DDA6